MAAYKFWRIHITRDISDALYVGLGEVVFRAYSGGAALPWDGLATAISSFSGEFLPPMAIDGDISTLWHSASSASPWWWQFEFAAPQDVREYTLAIPGSHAIRAPRDWQVWGSSDGVNWTVLSTETDQVFVDDVPNVYSVQPPLQFRLSGIAQFSDGAAADTVRVWRRGDAGHVLDIQPDPAGGTFSADVPGPGPYDLLIMRDGYRPLVHGPVTAEQL